MKRKKTRGQYEASDIRKKANKWTSEERKRFGLQVTKFFTERGRK